MSKEMVISANRHETKVAIIEDDQLVEAFFQRSDEYSLAGSIHKGRVTRVLPGMQSAFVDLGLERDTFLYVSDFLEEHDDFDKITGDERPPREARGEQRGDQRSDQRGDRRPDSRHFRREPRRDQGREQGRDFVRLGGREPGEDRPAQQLAPAAADGDEQLPQLGMESAAVDENAAPAAEAVGEALPQERIGEGSPERSEDRGGDHGDKGERRGRRSRRRRRGGFPQSKYAGDAAAQPDRGAPAQSPVMRQPIPESEPVAIVEDVPSAPNDATGGDNGPMLLPGESLAKYRRPVEPPVPARTHGGGARSIYGSLTEPPPLPASREVVAESAVSEYDETEFDEPIHFPRENAVPDAPVHEMIASQADADSADEPAAHAVSSSMPLKADAGPAALAPEAEAEESVATADAGYAGSEEEDERDVAVASLLDEEEDRDIQAMILGDVEGIEIEPLEGSDEESPDGAEDGSGESLEASGSADESGAAAGEAAGAQTESGTASVRERGDRFPHRVARRSRRRGRGGDRGDRGDRGPAPEARGPGLEAKGPEARGPETRSQEGRDRTVSRPNTNQPSIADLLKEGQEIIVQIAKEPLGQKGARITSHIALPGRYVVYMPTLEHMGVSRKISSDEERLRLKRVLQAQRPGPVGGYITRTAAEGRTEEEIAADMQFLYNLWQDIRTKAEKKPSPLLLHHDLDIVQRILRDQLGDNFKAVWIDNEEAYESVVRFVERFQPTLVGKVKLYTRDAPIFDAFNVTSELEKALRPKVWLKSGGFIVINQTEALVAIDVNTGKYVGKTNRLEDTIVKTNTEAIKEIVRQIRLRDLGGIIVIDFIDMDERKNRQKVMQVLEEAMRVDRAPYKILQFNDFGLVAITRKRVKQSLERTLCSPCPQCDGAGYVKSTQTVVSEILTEARKMAKTVEGKDVVLRVHPDVAKVLKSHQNKYLEELEEMLRRPVLIKSDPQLHQEKFDLA